MEQDEQDSVTNCSQCAGNESRSVGHWRGRSRGESGAVLILLALSLTLLMGIAGFSVDLGNWYLHVQRAQRASDAAALAGEPHLPGQRVTAYDTAYQQLLANGVPVSVAQAARNNPDCTLRGPCIGVATGTTTQLQVKVSTTVNNAFLGFLGVAKQNTFVRGATANYRAPLTFGGLSNVLGTEPDIAADGGRWQDPAYAALQPHAYLNMNGRRTQKSQGDRYSDYNCVGFPGSDGRTGGVTDLCPNGNNNAEYRADGYWYTFTAKRGATGRYMGVEIYDPAYINLGGGACNVNGANAYQRDPVRCPGDDADGPDHTPTTWFTLWNEDKTAVQCQQRFMGWNENVQTALNQNRSKGGIYFRDVFERWYNLCFVPIDGSQENTYHLQVTMDDQNGGNHFSLRNGIFNSASRSSKVDFDTRQRAKVSVLESFALINTLRAGTDVQFPLTRIPMSYAGQTVNFELFDIGDNSAPTGTSSRMTIVGSGDLSSQPGQWTCQYDMPYAPRNRPLTNLPGCTIGVDRLGWNGKIARFSIHVPANYTCNEADQRGCWTFIRMRFAVNANDVTTWTLREPGIPLRLVK